MKRKVGFLVGYNGGGYHGLQWNRDVHTIEGTVMEILLRNGLVTELNARDPQKIDMKSCSRTDKGVHASFNMINAKICCEPTPEMADTLRRDFGKSGIHLYKMIRVPKKFIGYKQARSRVYKYYVPTFFLRESDFTDEYLRREAEDTSGRGTSTQDTSDQSTSGQGTSGQDTSGQEDSSESGQRRKTIYRDYKMEDLVEMAGYRSCDIELFRRLMCSYAGTKSYHNFTIKTNQKDTKRFIRSVAVSDPTTVDGIEYVEITIHGQSFLLHQIRKMVSFAVLNCRYARGAAEENFRNVFSGHVHVPKAPSQYLFLSNVLFDDFNKKAEEKIEVDETEKERFERETVLPAIYDRKNLLEWMKFLDAVRFHHMQFPCFKRAPE